jgi:hypothetical protein
MGYFPQKNARPESNERPRKEEKKVYKKQLYSYLPPPAPCAREPSRRSQSNVLTWFHYSLLARGSGAFWAVCVCVRACQFLLFRPRSFELRASIARPSDGQGTSCVVHDARPNNRFVCVHVSMPPPLACGRCVYYTAAPLLPCCLLGAAMIARKLYIGIGLGASYHTDKWRSFMWQREQRPNGQLLTKKALVVKHAQPQLLAYFNGRTQPLAPRGRYLRAGLGGLLYPGVSPRAHS